MNTHNTEQDAIFLAVVNSIRRDFPNSSMGKMSDEESIQTAASWAGHLKHIPTNRVMGIYHALALGLKFPPTISEFADTWAEMAYQENQRQQDEKRRREDAELEKKNAAGTLFSENIIKLTQMNRQRWAAGLDAVCCDCETKENTGAIANLTKDGEYFCCELRNCNFREPVERFMDIRTHPNWKPVAGGLMTSDVIPRSPENVAPTLKTNNLMDEDELLENLESRCNFQVEKIGTQKALAFGKLLLKKEPILLRWNVDLARANWKEFIAEAV